jgi:hypothetical protein
MDTVKMEQCSYKNVSNRTARIMHKCRKAAVSSCHRCLINAGVKNEQHLNMENNFNNTTGV